MRFNRNTIHALFVLGLPVIVALLGLGPITAVVLVIAALLWRWMLTLTALLSRETGQELVLETISASHYVEKVRWCMDRLGVPYAERHNAGVIGVFFIGRTVPRLHVRTGSVVSRIGDSPAILRYLWGRYSAEYGQRAEFLKPTAESLALEAEIDRYGVLMQQWAYHHLLPHRKIALHVWGVNDPGLPFWQRGVIVVCFPLLRFLMRRAFRLTPESHARTVAKSEAFLQRMEDRLADGRTTLLGGEPGFVDITLAALSGVWIWPRQYGGGKAAAVRPGDDEYPESMQAEALRWQERYPRVSEFVENLYASQRY
jgi:glutathione S-transferase